MAVPKKRTTPRRRDNRRAQWMRTRPVRTAPCAQCNTVIPSHAACPTCGTYRGRTVIDTAAEEEKRLKKEKQRKQEAEEQGQA